MTRKSIIETKTFTEGEMIYSHNDLSDYIYLIEMGEVKILSKNGLELGLLKEGQNAGEDFGKFGDFVNKFVVKGELDKIYHNGKNNLNVVPFSKG